jgi:hypothetical protein
MSKKPRITDLDDYATLLPLLEFLIKSNVTIELPELMCLYKGLRLTSPNKKQLRVTGTFENAAFSINLTRPLQVKSRVYLADAKSYHLLNSFYRGTKLSPCSTWSERFEDIEPLITLEKGRQLHFEKINSLTINKLSEDASAQILRVYRYSATTCRSFPTKTLLNAIDRLISVDIPELREVLRAIKKSAKGEIYYRRDISNGNE